MKKNILIMYTMCVALFSGVVFGMYVPKMGRSIKKQQKRTEKVMPTSPTVGDVVTSAFRGAAVLGGTVALTTAALYLLTTNEAGFTPAFGVSTDISAISAFFGIPALMVGGLVSLIASLTQDVEVGIITKEEGARAIVTQVVYTEQQVLVAALDNPNLGQILQNFLQNEKNRDLAKKISLATANDFANDPKYRALRGLTEIVLMLPKEAQAQLFVDYAARHAVIPEFLKKLSEKASQPTPMLAIEGPGESFEKDVD